MNDIINVVTSSSSQLGCNTINFYNAMNKPYKKITLNSLS